jgi:hypothetical protein
VADAVEGDGAAFAVDGIRARVGVGVAARAADDDVRAPAEWPDDGEPAAVALVDAVAAPLAAADPPPPGMVAVTARWPPAAAAPGPLAPRAAQPAVSVIAPTSSAVVVSDLDSRVRRRLPFRPNITSILPEPIRTDSLRTGDGRRGRRITHFGLRIFRYPGLRVVSPKL